MSTITKVIVGIAACAGIVVSPSAVLAQSDYPNRPVKLIVGFAPGGSTDIVARIVAQKLGERLGQTIVVENRAGAGGTIGADATAKAPADGYTLTLGTTSTHAIAAGAYSKLPYNPVTDFTPISLVAITPYLLVVNPQVQARNLNEFLALAKSQPGKMNYASAGNGTATHLAMEMLKDAAKVDLVHIPYKGNAPADAAILAGEVQAVFGSMPALLQHAKANKVRPLAVGTVARSPALPTCRRSPSRAIPASTRHSGSASWARPTCRSRLSIACTRKSSRLLRLPNSRLRWTPTAPNRSRSKSPEEFREMLRGQVDKYVQDHESDRH